MMFLCEGLYSNIHNYCLLLSQNLIVLCQLNPKYTWCLQPKKTKPNKTKQKKKVSITVNQ
jgi:hypothetical protein